MYCNCSSVKICWIIHMQPKWNKYQFFLIHNKHIHTDRIMSIKLKLNDTNTIIRACEPGARPTQQQIHEMQFHAATVKWITFSFFFIYTYIYLLVSGLFFFSLNFRFCELFFWFFCLLKCDWKCQAFDWICYGIWPTNSTLDYIWCQAKIN